MNIFYYIQRKVEDIYYDAKELWQHLIRWDHVSDRDVWGMNDVFIKKMYPYVRRFVKSKWRQGFHVLPEYWDNEGMSITDEDAAIKAWEEVLNKILFAFEFHRQDDFSDKTAKKLEAKLKREYGDWEAEDLKYCVIYDEQDITGSWITHYDKITDEQKDKFISKYGIGWFQKVRKYYHNGDLYFNVLHKKAEEGMKLFGEYAMGMWD
jgi:hypothetical protein